MNGIRAQWLGSDTAVLIKTDKHGREWYSVVTARLDVRLTVAIPDVSTVGIEIEPAEKTFVEVPDMPMGTVINEPTEEQIREREEWLRSDERKRLLQEVRTALDTYERAFKDLNGGKSPQSDSIQEEFSFKNFVDDMQDFMQSTFFNIYTMGPRTAKSLLEAAKNYAESKQ